VLWDGNLVKDQQHTLHTLDTAEVSCFDKEVGRGGMVGAHAQNIGGGQSILFYLSHAPSVDEQNDIFHARPRCQAVIFPPPWWGGAMPSQRGCQDMMMDMSNFGNITVKVLEF
jgi:hypothetical protein